MNPQYQRKFRAQTHQPAQQEPRRQRPKHRKRRSLLAMILMIVGAATLFVLLMRYAIIPLLVMLPKWLGGVA